MKVDILGHEQAPRPPSGGDAEGDRLINIENLIGSDHADTLTGNDGDNVLQGGPGGDTITGRRRQRHGQLRRIAGGGDRQPGDRFRLHNVRRLWPVTAGSVSGGNAAGDTLTGIENVTGSDHADVLCGDDGDNVIQGGAGGDTIICGGGNDTLVYAGSPEGVSVNMADTVQVGGHAERDAIIDVCGVVIGSDHDDSLTSGINDHAITLVGGGGNDKLYGAAGGDTLNGGPGGDTLTANSNTGLVKLTGGPGDDTLIVATSRASTNPAKSELYFHMGFGRDTVQNFDLAHDTIYLCGMEGMKYSGWPRSDGYRISVYANQDITFASGRTRTFHFFQGSITLEGVTLPFSSNTPPTGLDSSSRAPARPAAPAPQSAEVGTGGGTLTSHL